MKLFIGVPLGEIPEEAYRLAKQIQLSIKSDESYSSVGVYSQPEVSDIYYSDSVVESHLHSVRVVHEFSVIKNQIVMSLIDTNGKKSLVCPVMQERHMAIFHNRFESSGTYAFDIVLHESVLFSGEINVIKG